MSDRIRVLFILFTALVLSGCEPPKPLDLTLGTVGEPEQQIPATIVFGSAEVFSRETLINDRNTELAFIEKELEDSVGAEFESDLRRDLQSVRSLAITTAIGFNPSAADRAQREDDLLALQQQVTAQNLQNQLAALRTGTSSEGPKAVTEGQPDPNSQTVDPQAIPKPSTVDRAAADAARDAKLQELEKQIAALRNTSVPKADVSLSPEERFRTLRDFRAEIRAARSSLNLDDVHDTDGNSLYRLQFHATVVPPTDEKNRWGVARLEIAPPAMDATDIETLYFTWLTHVTDQLNRVIEPDPAGTTEGTLEIDPQHFSLGANTALFDTVRISIGAERFIQVAVPRDNGFFDVENDTGRQLLDHQIGAAHRLSQAIERSTGCPDLTNISSAQEIETTIGFAQRILQASPAIGDAFRILGPRGVLVSPSFLNDAISRLRQFDEANAESRKLLQTLGGVPEACRADIKGKFQNFATNLNDWDSFFSPKTYRDKGRKVPEGFTAAIVKLLENSRTFAFSVTPAATSQRVSTLAKASNALQLSLALAATIPESGVSADLGADLLRSAAGSVEALERLPQVVGFVGRGQPAATTTQQGANGTPPDKAPTAPTSAAPNPYFGWFFGPRAAIDTANNQLLLSHGTAQHVVTADMSVPGWWPWIEINSETAWVGKLRDLRFSNGDIMGFPHGSGAPPTHKQPIRVKLPLSRSDLDALTNVLAQEKLKQQLRQVRIDDVRPNVLHRCSDENRTFILSGSDLWRDPAVFLAGQPSKDRPKVLPDMGGIAVTFDLRGLASRIAEPGKAELTVWTRTGVAARTIDVRCEAAASQALAFRLDGPPRFHAGKSDFTVAIVSGFPPAGGTLKVQVSQHTEDEVKLAWRDLGTTPSLVFPRVIYPQIAAQSDWKSGTLVDLSIVRQMNSQAEALRFDADRTVRAVYYQNEAATKSGVQSPGTGELDTLDGQALVAKLPENWSLAFPLFGPNTAKLQAFVGGQNQPLTWLVPLTSASFPNPIATRFTADLFDPPGNLANRLAALRAQGNVPVGLRFVDEAGDALDAPVFDRGLVLKKKP